MRVEDNAQKDPKQQQQNQNQNQQNDQKQQRDDNKGKKEEKIKIKQVSVFSKDWAKAHGSPFEDDQTNDGHKFENDDFTCDVGFGFNAKVFKARIKSIRKHVAKVVDEKGEESTIYFGGCSRI